VAHQPHLAKGEGPIVLVVAPTHELAEQIVRQVRKLGKGVGVRCAGLFGGVSKFEQFKELKGGAEVVVGTPGRLLEMCKAKGGLTLGRASFVVVDEADRPRLDGSQRRYTSSH